MHRTQALSLPPLQSKDVWIPTLLGVIVVVAGVRGIALHAWPDNWDATDYAARFMELAAQLREGVVPFLRGFPGTHGPLLPIVASVLLAMRDWTNPYLPLAYLELAALAGTIMVLYVLLRRLVSPLWALAGTAIYALTLNQIYWSTQILYEGFGYFLTPLMLMAVDRHRRLCTRDTAFIAGAFVGLTTLTRLNIAIPSIAVFLACLMTTVPRGRWLPPHPVAAVLPLVPTTVLWYGVTIWHTLTYFSYYSQEPSLGLAWTGTSQSLLRTEYEYLLYVWNFWGTGAMLMLALTILCGVPIAIWQLRARTFSLTTSAAIFTVVTLAICLAASAQTERYLTPALLPSIVAIAGIAGERPFRGASFARYALVAAACLQAAVLLDGLRSFGPRSEALLHGPTPSPRGYWSHSNNPARLLQEAAKRAQPGSRVLFIGHNAQMDNVTVRYWNLAERTGLEIEYGWDPLAARASTAGLPSRIQSSSYVLFSPAHAGDGHLFAEASTVAADTLERLRNTGGAEMLYDDPTGWGTFFSIRAGTIARQAFE